MIYRLGKNLSAYNRDHNIRIEAKKLIEDSKTTNKDKEILTKIREMKKGYIAKRYKIIEKRTQNGNK